MARHPIPPSLLIVYAELRGPRGRTMLRLALDTGASYTLLPPEILATVGYAPHTAPRTSAVLTASGSEWTPLVTITSLRFLGCEVKHLNVVSHTLPPNSPVEGLLGLDALQHFLPFQAFLRSLRFLQRVASARRSLREGRGDEA